MEGTELLLPLSTSILDISSGLSPACCIAASCWRRSVEHFLTLLSIEVPSLMDANVPRAFEV